MAEIKDAFVCYRSYVEAIRLLPENKRWSFFEKVIDYALDGVNPDLVDNDAILAFTLMKANIDSCGRRYQSSVENGKKGGNPNFERGKSNPYYKNNPTKKDNLDNPKDNVNVNGTLSKVSEEGAEKAPPPPQKDKPFLLDGVLHEYYIADDGERRVRKIDRQP